MTPKYKAWDTKRKKMWSAEEMGRDQLTLSPDGRGFVNVSGTSTRLSQYLPHLIPLQFTGLLDKNGKELDWWEGDILKPPKGIVGIIKMDEEQGLWRMFVRNRRSISLYRAKLHHWTKIGDIHTTPDLLEGKQ